MSTRRKKLGYEVKQVDKLGVRNFGKISSAYKAARLMNTKTRSK